MHEATSYPGGELELFAEAHNWKQYYAGLLSPYIHGDVLEVGAGIGSTTRFLVNSTVNSWTLLEPDRSHFELLEQLIRNDKLPGICRARHGDIGDLQHESRYDTILYIDVLEHIENDKAEMESAIQLIKPGGQIIILSPAHQSLYSPFDASIGHQRRYNKKGLRRLLNGVGVTEQLLRYLDSLGCFSSLANKWFLKQSLPTGKQVRFWDKRLIPVSRIMDRILGWQLGKTIIGIWRKDT